MNTTDEQKLKITMNSTNIHLPTPNPNHPYQSNGQYQFPKLKCLNINGQSIIFPDTEENSTTDYLIILCAFIPEAIYSLKTWFPQLDKLIEQHSDSHTHINYKTLINIPPPITYDDLAHYKEALITLHTNNIETRSAIYTGNGMALKENLSIHKKSCSAILLLDKYLNIIWTCNGKKIDEQYPQLHSILELLAPTHSSSRYL